MTWITTNLNEAFIEINATMKRAKTISQQSITRMATESVPASYIVDGRAALIKIRSTLNALSGTAGLVAYIRNELNDANYDAAANFTAVISALNAVITNIESVFPADANDYLLIYKFDATDISERVFTPTQTATLRVLLQAIVDAIE